MKKTNARKQRVKIGKYHKVFQGIFFTVEHAKAIFPSGTVKTFEKATRIPSVTILAIDAKGKLLLTREYRPKYGHYVWFLPAGRIDREKDPKKAALRELREETGFGAKQLRLFHVTDMSQTLNWKVYTYVATNLYPAPLEGDEDEDIIVVPTSLQKAYFMAVDGTIRNEGMAYLIITLYLNRKKWLSL